MLFLATWHPTPALAQAVIPPPGVATFSLSYEFFDGGDHLFSTDAIDGESSRGYTAEGNRWYLGDTWAHTVLASLDVGLHRRLGLTLGAAVVSSMYEGNAPVDPTIDDGEYRTTVQDGLVRLRSPFAVGAFLLTPFVGAAFPLNEYPEYGHSAPGRGLIQVLGGFHALRGLGAYGSFGYLAADLGYGWITNISETDLGRLTAAVRFGYYPSRRLTLMAGASHLETFGGYEWASDDPSAPAAHGSGESAVLHFQSSAARSTIVGAGFDWGLTERFGINLGVHTTVWGENVDDATLIVGGIVWSFRMFGGGGATAPSPG